MLVLSFVCVATHARTKPTAYLRQLCFDFEYLIRLYKHVQKTDIYELDETTVMISKNYSVNCDEFLPGGRTSRVAYGIFYYFQDEASTKNPFDTNRSAIEYTASNANSDKSIGKVKINTAGSGLSIKSCFKYSCSDINNRIEKIISW